MNPKNPNTKNTAAKTAYKTSPQASIGFNTKTTKATIFAALSTAERKLASMNKKYGVKAVFTPSSKHDAKTLKSVVLADLLAVEKKLLAIEAKVGKAKVSVSASASTRTKSSKSAKPVVIAPKFDEAAALAIPMYGTTGSTFTPVFANTAGRVGFRNLGFGTVRVRVELAKKGVALDLPQWRQPSTEQNRYSYVGENKDAIVEFAKTALQAAAA